MNDYGIKQYAHSQHIVMEEVWRLTEYYHSSGKVVNFRGETHTAKVYKQQLNLLVGDYVRVVEIGNEVVIVQELPRKNILSKSHNSTMKSRQISLEEQQLAANINRIFVFISADQRFTLSKLERYLLVFSSLSVPINIVITKSDYADKAQWIEEQISSVYPELQIIHCSIYDEHLVFQLAKCFVPGETAVLIGASGVGKSSFINKVARKDVVKVNEVRADGKGKHTTTSTKLLYLEPLDAYIIDMPGFKSIETHREIDDSILFDEIYVLALQCKFRDCKHQTEPGCAVKKAVAEGVLDAKKLERYFVQLDKRKKYERYLLLKERTKKKS